MKRKIVKINEDKCNGCGLCINACHESALEIINNKAVLISDSYCDGLGDCLMKCPVDAIEIIEREANDFDKELVEKRMNDKNVKNKKLDCGCPGHNTKLLKQKNSLNVNEDTLKNHSSNLMQWPVQIKLVSANAQYFNNADLLIAADCTAYAYANIHEDFMKNKITIIGCPKLDNVDYSEKLTDIIKNNDIRSITVLRMEVPCCAGIVSAVQNAINASGKEIRWNYEIVSSDGKII